MNPKGVKVSKKSKKKKTPGRAKFRKSIEIDKDFEAVYWTPEMEKKLQELHEKELKEEREREERSSGSSGSKK